MNKLLEIQQAFQNVFSKELIKNLADNGVILEKEKGTKIISKGDTIKYMPIVLSGTIKVIRTDENIEDEEHILFYLNEKEACVSTFSICLDKKKSEIDFILETPSKILMYPIHLMDYLTRQFPEWRYYICQNYNTRMKEFLETMDTIVFMKMDKRILTYLKNTSKALETKTLNITHQKIAKDLSTSRVVVSRLLKQLENEGVLKLYRNKIELL